MQTGCRIELFGGLRVLMGERTVTRFQTQKTGALLGYLALNAGKSFPRDMIAEMLWPDGDAVAVRNRLNQAVSSLRRQLHPPGSEPNAVLAADHASVSINADRVTTDIAEFHAFLQEAASLEGEEALAKLRSAIDLYSGPLIDGSQESWAIMERAIVADLCYEATTKLIRAYAYSERVPEAIEIANGRLAQDPGEERSHRALMRLYLMAGRPRSALAQFADLERALAIEGDLPSARALKLRDEALEMASNDTGPKEPPRVPAPPVAQDSSNLPQYTAPFFGRENELAMLESAVSSGHRLISLTGLGGGGKTRLAVELARRTATSGGNVAFVGLTDVGSSAVVIEEAERALGAIATKGPSAQTLLILDNVEQSIESAGKAVAMLMRSHPQVSFVITSRVPLAVKGEVVLPVLPLATAETGSLVELAVNPAIALFVNRAQAVRQDFQLTERNRDAIVELCVHLEGWPLAIELAASWARSLTPSQMAERVSENYNHLVSRRKDIQPRHRSMRAAIDGSYATLTDAQRDDFRRLSVFEGGWEHTAAAAVCPGSDLYQSLASLEEAGLIRTETLGGFARSFMLESVKAFARDLTTPDLNAEIRRLHAEYFRTVVARSTRKGSQGVAAIKRDRPNVLTALGYWVESGETETAVSYAIDLGAYWDFSGRLQEGVEWLERVLPIADDIGDSDHGLLLTRYARLIWSSGDFDRASGLYSQALKLFEKAEDLEHVLEVTVNVAQEAHRQADYARAIELLTQNLTLAEQLGDRWAEARSFLAMGNAQVELGQVAEGQAGYEACLQTARELEAHVLIGAAMGNLGNLMRIQGRLDEANDWLRQAIALYEEAGLRAHTVDAYVMLGHLRLRQGAPDEALALVRRGFQLGIETAYLTWETLELAAQALIVLGQTERAAQVLGHAEQVWRPTDASSIESAAHARYVEEVRKALGTDRANEYFETGRNADRAIVIALVTEEPCRS